MRASWRWTLAILGVIGLILILGVSITQIDIGERVTRIDIGPFHLEHYNRNSHAAHASREFAISETQPSNFALLLDNIFRNEDFILKFIATLIPVVILFALFSFQRYGFTRFREMDRTRIKLPLLSLSAIIIVVAIGVYAFWADEKAEGSAAFLSPPGPACKPKRDSAKTAIVLIHGWNGADTSWRRFPELLCQDNDCNYPPPFSARQSG